jgi:uracil-DNA glycosylase
MVFRQDMHREIREKAAGSAALPERSETHRTVGQTRKKQQGKPFGGPAGRRLDKLLVEAGIDR